MGGERDALTRAVVKALRFCDWAAGEGLYPEIDGKYVDPAEFLYDAVSEQGVDEIEPFIAKVLARLDAHPTPTSEQKDGRDDD